MRRGFTIIELIVVMAIITLLSTFTLIAVRSIADDARQSSASNAIRAALGTARAEAIRSNRTVGVVIIDGAIEIVIDSGRRRVVTTQNDRRILLSEFDPMPGTERSSLPRGVAVYGPDYRNTRDEEWVEGVGVYFAPDGSLAALGGFPDDPADDTFIPSIPYSAAFYAGEIVPSTPMLAIVDSEKSADSGLPLTDWINANADIITFNRYSGVLAK